MSLFQRAVAINASVIVVAVVLLAVSPASVSSHLKLAEAAVLVVGTALMIVGNLLLLRRVFGPLERLTALMERVDPQEPGRRIALNGEEGEVARLATAFNAMLDRLEDERRSSGRRALTAQENERGRLARELHDEIGQTLTGVVLQLEALQRRAPPELHAGISEAQETARGGVEDMREIARGLRPQALDEFGLRSALVSLAAQVTDRSGTRVRPSFADDLPRLEPEQDLAVYRVAQEGLTNVARHAGASTVGARGSRAPATAASSCVVRDDGRGIAPAEAATGNSGVAGMRERALLDRGPARHHGPARRRHRGAARDPRRGDRVSTPLRTRILLADDHPVVRRGLSLVLDAAPGPEVVAEAADGIEAVELGLREDVDLAILDVAMPRRTGLHAARELTRRRPGAARADALHARRRGVLLRGPEGGRERLRAQDGGRPRPGRGLPRGDARRAVPVPADDPHGDALLPRRPGRLRAGRAADRRASRRSRSSSPSRTAPRRSPTCWPSARARSSAIARTSSPASGMRDRVALTRWAIRHGLVDP